MITAARELYRWFWDEDAGWVVELSDEDRMGMEYATTELAAALSTFDRLYKHSP